MSWGATLTRAVVAGAVTRAAWSALRRATSQTTLFDRTNHRGAPVSLLEGPAVALGAGIGSLVADERRRGLAGALAVAGAGAWGGYDDLAGNSNHKGLGGHLSALAQGEVTSGALKIAGIGGAGLVAGRILHGSNVDAVLAGAVIAGCANLGNLLDLRPGRAAKVAVLAGVLGGPAAAGAGAAVAVLPDDLAEHAMLGDCGANALGAAIGVSLASGSSRHGLLIALGLVTAITVASERVSFTQVIESTPGLREFDALGRQPRG